MESGTIISIAIGIVTLTFTMVVNYFAFVIKTNVRLTKVETRYEIFWKVLEPHLANIIHSPIHTRRDELVDKLVHEHITMKERAEVIKLLIECIDDCTQNQKLAAALLLARAASEVIEDVIE